MQANCRTRQFTWILFLPGFNLFPYFYFVLFCTEYMYVKNSLCDLCNTALLFLSEFMLFEHKIMKMLRPVVC